MFNQECWKALLPAGLLTYSEFSESGKCDFCNKPTFPFSLQMFSNGKKSIVNLVLSPHRVKGEFLSFQGRSLQDQLKQSAFILPLMLFVSYFCLLFNFYSFALAGVCVL